MAGHSPGPWELTELACGNDGEVEPSFRIEAASTLFLTVSPCADGFQFGQNEANARLIAAAPDLLEAATALLPVLEMMSEWDDGCLYVNNHSTPEMAEPMRLLKAAIAKAIQP